MTALDTKALLVGVTPGDWEAAGWRIMGDGQQVAGCELMLRAPIEEGEAETRQNARLIASAPRLARRVIELEEALEPFGKALGKIADKDTQRWPDNETIEHSGAAEEITWGDLRKARAALTIQGEAK